MTKTTSNTSNTSNTNDDTYTLYTRTRYAKGQPVSVNQPVGGWLQGFTYKATSPYVPECHEVQDNTGFTYFVHEENIRADRPTADATPTVKMSRVAQLNEVNSQLKLELDSAKNEVIAITLKYGRLSSQYADIAQELAEACAQLVRSEHEASINGVTI